MGGMATESSVDISDVPLAAVSHSLDVKRFAADLKQIDEKNAKIEADIKDLKSTLMIKSKLEILRVLVECLEVRMTILENSRSNYPAHLIERIDRVENILKNLPIKWTKEQ